MEIALDAARGAPTDMKRGRPGRLGTHVLVDLEGCDRLRIDDVEGVREAMLAAARVAGATVVTETFHRFSPQGVSGVVVITESHLAVHTWPEFGAVAIDLFTCGSTIDAELAADSLARAFGAASRTFRSLDRSERPEPPELVRPVEFRPGPLLPSI